MDNQEFINPENEFHTARNANTDPREQPRTQQEQWHEQVTLPEGYYREWQTGEASTGLGWRQIQDGKVRPGRIRQLRGWLLLPLLMAIGLIMGGLVSYAGHRQLSRPSPAIGVAQQPVVGVRQQPVIGAAQPRVFIFPGISNLKIRDEHGSIHVHAGQTNQIIVQPIVDATAIGSSSVEGLVEYRLNDDEQELEITANEDSFAGFSRINLDITVPQQVNIEADTHTGSVDLQGVNGEVNVKSESGQISIAQSALHGESHVKADNGSISFNGSLDAQGSYRFETDNGAVNLTLPGNSAFHLNVNTDSGMVHNDFVSADVGNGLRPNLSLSTENGAITLHKEP